MNDYRLCKNELNEIPTDKVHKQRKPTSFWMQNPEIVFAELKLEPGAYFLDIGCGTGDYSLQAASIVGDSGQVYALDVQDQLITNLKENANREGLKNVKAMTSDITCPLPVKDNSIDVCFISTVLHSIDLEKHAEMLFNEIRRVLKPEGRLVIIECNTEDVSRGPPLNMRISPEELEKLAEKFEFYRMNLVDLGFNYMMKFVVKS